MNAYKKETGMMRIWSLILVTLLVGWAAAADSLPYDRQQNIVYTETHGIGLLADIFVPKENANGLAVIDVVSGAWHSDAGKLRDHERAQMFNIYCSRGYTVFGIRPGSVTKFTGDEMLEHVKEGIRYVKSRADEFGIDPDRIGIVGASAGGHLALLSTVYAENGDDKKPDTRVKAAAVFFPPTDFLQWGEDKPDYSGSIGHLFYHGGVNGQPDEEVAETAKRLSPLHNIPEITPPYLLIHGDADPLVPLPQSEKFVAAVNEKGGSAELIVKPGGGHPWLTIHEEVAIMADWFDKNL
jgi:dipeptidyl aminopeptidase/acylaminoacyl peptidase